MYIDTMPIIHAAAKVNFIDLEIEDIVKALALYDVIQVWRSPDNIAAYTEITGTDDLPAVIDGTVAGTWNLNGTSLTVVKNSNDPVTINFSGTNPFDLLTVIKVINTTFPNFASQVPSNTNRLRLTSDMLGLISNLTLSGSATSVLGLTTTKVIGRAHRIPLTNPTTKYRFLDPDGLSTDYYKTRFYNTKTRAASTYSEIVRATIPKVLSDSDLVTASITLSNMNGEPLIDKRVIIIPMSLKRIGSTSLVSSQDRIIMTTDQYGFASTKITKGMTVRVYIEATGFEREIVVPNTDFDIMAVTTVAPDPFSIVTTPPLAIRISL